MKAAKKRSSAPGLETRDLRADDWPIVEELFGPRGACGGCWCMWWRLRGKDWESAKGAGRKRAFKRLVESGAVYGCLAFDGDEPVGWCNLGPRGDFPRLEHSRAIQSEAGPEDWAVTCFFIPPGRRRQGVASALLEAAIDLARREGKRLVEGYPVYNKKQPGAPYPATFAFTGVPSLFAKKGFRDATPEGSKRLIFRRGLRPKG